MTGSSFTGLIAGFVSVAGQNPEEAGPRTDCHVPGSGNGFRATVALPEPPRFRGARQNSNLRPPPQTPCLACEFVSGIQSAMRPFLSGGYRPAYLTRACDSPSSRRDFIVWAATLTRSGSLPWGWRRFDSVHSCHPALNVGIRFIVFCMAVSRIIRVVYTGQCVERTPAWLRGLCSFLCNPFTLMATADSVLNRSISPFDGDLVSDSKSATGVGRQPRMPRDICSLRATRS